MARRKIEPKYEPADFEAGRVRCPLCPLVPSSGSELKDHIADVHRNALEGLELDKKGINVVTVIYCAYRDHQCKFSAPRHQVGNMDTHMNRHFSLKPHRCPHTQDAQEDEPPEHPDPPCTHADADPANLRKHRRDAHGWRSGATAAPPPNGEPTFGVFNAQPQALQVPEDMPATEAMPGQPVRRARSTSRARYAPYTAPPAAAQAGPSRATEVAALEAFMTAPLPTLDTTMYPAELVALPFSGLSVTDDAAPAAAFDGGAVQSVDAPFPGSTSEDGATPASTVDLLVSILQRSLEKPDVPAQAPVYADADAAATEEASYGWSSPSSASSDVYGQPIVMPNAEPGWHPAISTLTYSGPEPLPESEPVPRNLVESGWSPDVILRFNLLEAQSPTSA